MYSNINNNIITRKRHIKQFKYHIRKFSNLKCSIAFLSACLSFRVIPKGLRPTFPISGLPPSLHDEVTNLSNQTSLTFTELVFNSYQILAHRHNTELNCLYERILYLFPNIKSYISNIMMQSDRRASKKMEKLNKKLNNLLENRNDQTFNRQSYPFPTVYANHSPYHVRNNYSNYNQTNNQLNLHSIKSSISDQNQSANIRTSQAPTNMDPIRSEHIDNKSFLPLSKQSVQPYPVQIDNLSLANSKTKHTKTSTIINSTKVNLKKKHPDIIENQNLNTCQSNEDQTNSKKLTHDITVSSEKSKVTPKNMQIVSFSAPQVAQLPETKSSHNEIPSNFVSAIENLSNHKLTQDESSVLSKGLTFSPTPRFDHLNLVTDTLAFARKTRLKYFFSKQDKNKESNSNSLPKSLNKYSPKSGWQPDPLPADHPVEQFLNVIISNVSDPNFIETLPKSKNLTSSEQKALKSLKSNKNIMILPADKGNSTVILNYKDYIDEINRQLEDNSTYKKLDNDPTENFNNEIRDYLIQNGPKQNLSPEIINVLTPKSPETPVFYILPKIHKPTRPPPGRPIVASIGSPTERISAYVDDHLQPFVKNLPSHIKNSNDLITKLKQIQQPFASEIHLVTIDVESLYTNIPHEDGIESSKHYLNLRQKNSVPSTQFLTTLIYMVLTMNNFRFKNQHYLQQKGTAMGTKMAPSFANLYMGLLEEKFLNSQNFKPLVWFRFIDDIFLIWQHSSDKLNQFLNNLNKFSSLKFTWNISQEIITFLDIDLFLENGFIKSKIHVKDTNKMEYLHYTSCHPQHIKKSIPKSLSFRATTLCSNESDLKHYESKLNDAFYRRGYPKTVLQSQIGKRKNSKKQQQNEAKFITKYHPGLYRLNGIIKTACKILDNSVDTKNLFSRPPRIIFKKTANLKNILVHPKLPIEENIPSQQNSKKCHPCKKPRCGTCKIISTDNKFLSSTTQKSYPISGKIDCNTKNVVYKLTCKHCSVDYIGETSTPLRIRMSNHRCDVNHKNKIRPVSAHAGQHNKSFEECFTLTGIKKVADQGSKERNKLLLKEHEQAHILVLKSKTPEGLNLR